MVMPTFGNRGPDPKAQEIRTRILEQLAALYRDPDTRSQFQGFVFQPSEQRLAEDVLRTLAAHLIVELKTPTIARLTELGYRVLPPARSAASPAGAGEPPEPEVLRRLVSELGEADYVSTSRLVNGEFKTDWAEGLEQVIGYSIEDLEAAGGWPIVLRHPDPKDLERIFRELLAGKPVTGETTLEHRSGQRLQVRFISWPRWDANRTRVVGTIGAGRVVAQA